MQMKWSKLPKEILCWSIQYMFTGLLCLLKTLVTSSVGIICLKSITGVPLCFENILQPFPPVSLKPRSTSQLLRVQYIACVLPHPAAHSTQAQAVPIAQSLLNSGWFCEHLAVTCQLLTATFSNSTASLLLSSICRWCCDLRTADPQRPAYLSLPGLSAQWLLTELPHPVKAQPLLSFTEEPHGFHHLRNVSSGSLSDTSCTLRDPLSFLQGRFSREGMTFHWRIVRTVTEWWSEYGQEDGKEYGVLFSCKGQKSFSSRLIRVTGY